MDWFQVSASVRSHLLMVFIIPVLCLGSCAFTSQPTDKGSPVMTEAAPRLIEATLARNLETVSVLLEQGTDPNLVYNTNTALTYAARDGFIDIARLLIDYGADVNWIDGEGVTPLILAAFKDHIELVQLLLNHGADTTVRDQWNRNALDYALRRGDADPIAQLLRQSMENDATSESGFSNTQ